MFKRFGVVVAACMVACVAAFSLAGCSQSEEYVPEELTPTVASPTIGEDGVLRVGVNTDNPPLAGSSTEIIGIDVDIAAALADALGLKLELVEVGSSPLNALEQGLVDIVMGVDESNTDAAMWKSDAYIPTGIALFATSEFASVPTVGDDVSFVAQVSSASSWAVTTMFGASTLTAASDLESAFELLAEGAVDYVAADAVIGMYVAHAGGFETSIIATLGESTGYVIGVLESNRALQQVIATALQDIQSDGIVSVIESKWLGGALNLDATPVVGSSDTES